MATIGSVLQTGVNGIHRGIRGAADAADKIAKVGIEPTGGKVSTDNATIDIADAAVSLKQNENLVKASARVVQAADEMIGSILDIKV